MAERLACAGPPVREFSRIDNADVCREVCLASKRAELLLRQLKKLGIDILSIDFRLEYPTEQRCECSHADEEPHRNSHDQNEDDDDLAHQLPLWPRYHASANL